MNSLAQDFINNFLIVFFAYFICKEQEKRSYFLLRCIACYGLVCVFRYLYFNQLMTIFDRDIRIYFRMLGFALLIFSVVGSIPICYKCDFFSSLFAGTFGYCIQFICQRVYSYSSGKFPEGTSPALYYLLYFGIIVLAFIIVYFSLKKFDLCYLIVNRRPTIVISIFAIIATIILNLFFSRFLREGGEELRVCYNIFVILLVLVIILYEMATLKAKNNEIERDNIKEILKKSKEQYSYEKSVIDLMNIKFHDLKHQIENLEADQKELLSQEISEAVETYDAIVRTNNPALDVVLTRTNFICKKKNIYYTCMADNDCLSPFKETDVYSLFGNILDNAIEAVDKVDNADKRVIDIRITKKNYFINIHEENYFSGVIKMFDGVPQTIKKDKNIHGYGVKSIQSIVNKYKGSVSFKTLDDRFILDIIFPLNE